MDGASQTFRVDAESGDRASTRPEIWSGKRQHSSFFRSILARPAEIEGFGHGHGSARSAGINHRVVNAGGEAIRRRDITAWGQIG